MGEIEEKKVTRWIIGGFQFGSPKVTIARPKRREKWKAGTIGESPNCQQSPSNLAEWFQAITLQTYLKLILAGDGKVFKNVRNKKTKSDFSKTFF